MKSKYLLSVVVPTRNRQCYAKRTVEQVLSITAGTGEVQIVITDNSNTDELREILGDMLTHPDILYCFTPYRIPGVDNYAKGIELSEGEYVCCIGDDDAVLVDILPVTQWASAHDVSAVKFGVQAAYIWPNALKGRGFGQLSLDQFSSNVYEVDAEKELINFLRTGCSDLPAADIPKAYHGLVRRDMYEIIKQKTGRYCGGLSPDIYLAVSLATLVDRLVCIDIPLTVFGACRQSTTGDSLNKVNVSKLEDAPHFVGQDYEWDSLVPRYYCGANIWADSALHALSDLGKIGLRNEFSVEEIAAYGLVECPDFIDEISEFLNRTKHDEARIAELVTSLRRAKRNRAIKERIKNNNVFSSIFYNIRSAFRGVLGDQRLLMRNIGSCAEAAEIVHNRIAQSTDEVLDSLRSKGSLCL